MVEHHLQAATSLNMPGFLDGQLSLCERLVAENLLYRYWDYDECHATYVGIDAYNVPIS